MSAEEFDRVRRLTAGLWDMLGGDPAMIDRLKVTGEASLISPFPVTDLASAAVAAIGLAAAELVEAVGAPHSEVTIDRVLTSAWCRHASSQPVGARRRDTPEGGPRPSGPSIRMNDFETRDGRYLRFQANYEHPRERILNTLGVTEDYDAVVRVVKEHDADELEQAIVNNGGTVAASHSIDEWLALPQGKAVASEPLLEIEAGSIAPSSWEPTPGRPLAGIKVLDMTRVLAGPTATSVLAGLGAEVLRIEAPDGDELSGGGDHLLGKRWAIVDARSDTGREQLLALLSDADVFIHGYRPGALDGLGLGPDVREKVRPGLIEATLNAYGWTGPWSGRRGFDTIMQFSTGLAVANTDWAREDPENRPLDVLNSGQADASRPRVLPIQILDYGAGFLLAAASIRGLTRRLASGEGSRARTALARVAHKVISDGQAEASTNPIKFPLDGPFEDRIITTSRGPVRRLLFPVTSDSAPIYWERSYELAGSSTPVWSTV